jgi:KaiC/GvpD/RAD55 family RecA-like ATPase
VSPAVPRQVDGGQRIDREQLTRGLSLFHADGEVFEIRVLDAVGATVEGRTIWRGDAIVYGYFDKVSRAVDEIDKAVGGSRAVGTYTTLNLIPSELLARAANRFREATKKDMTTKDSSVSRLMRLLMDFDRDGEKGISSTEEEKAISREVAEKVRDFLRWQDWPEPVLIDSGNGYHLIYAIDLPAGESGLVEKVLKALAKRFDVAGKGSLDVSVHNPSRITKLPGTWARKGDDTSDRPHRMAKIIDEPEMFGEYSVLREKLEALAAEVGPKAPGSTPDPDQGGGFLEAWLSQNAPTAKKRAARDDKDREVWNLDPCLCHPDHGGTGAIVTREKGGRLGYNCFHETCTSCTWTTLRDKFRDTSKPAATPETKRVVRLSLVDVIRGIKRRDPLPLGLPHLDAMLGGGLSAGESLVLGGGPGTIKTTSLVTIIKALAGPKTAIFGVFFDEHYERVCRKIAVRFGLRYDETEEPTEGVLERLRGELTRRDAIFETVSGVTDPTIEEIVTDCLSATPEGRVPIFVIDHLHRLRSAATSDRDMQSVAVGKVVNAVLRATEKGAAVIALSEVTKAALNPEVVRANPLAVFADSRAIASRFDIALATVRIPPPPGTDEILAEVLGTGKNRFGSGHAKYVSALDLSTWKITTRDAEGFETEAEERKAAAKGKENADRMRQDDELVLAYVVRHAVSQEIGCKARDVEEGIPAESGGAISQRRARAAVFRLRGKKRLNEHDWKPAGKRGPEAKYVRVLPEGGAE